jgi:hypothetical protein
VFGITDIALDQAIPLIRPVRADVSLLHRTVVEGIEIVEHGDLIAVGQKGIDDVAADESGAACDEYLHDALNLTRDADACLNLDG